MDPLSKAERREFQRTTAVAHHAVARVGYTDHHPGMYSDRFAHKNLQTDAGRYNWLGTKYQDPDRERPERWKHKQFGNAAPQWYPGSNVEGNLYGLNGKRVPALREGDVYASVHAPVRKDTAGGTKVGFGFTVGKTKFVPDMSTSTKAARFLDALKREQKGQKKVSDAELNALAEDYASEGPKLAWGEPPNLYPEFEGEENADPYREFVPAHLRGDHAATTRQQRQKQSTKPRVYGLQRPQSATIGESAWQRGGADGVFASEAHAKTNATRYFTDRGHVGTNERAPGNAPFVKASTQSFRASKR
jgi:hypothetical protein